LREAGSSPGGDLHSSGTYGPFYKMPPAGIFDLRIFSTSSESVMTAIVFMGDAHFRQTIIVYHACGSASA